MHKEYMSRVMSELLPDATNRTWRWPWTFWAVDAQLEDFLDSKVMHTSKCEATNRVDMQTYRPGFHDELDEFACSSQIRLAVPPQRIHLRLRA